MKHFHCPVNGWDCPYYKSTADIDGKEEHCLCTMENPYEECDDFYASFGDNCKPEDYTDDTDY